MQLGKVFQQTKECLLWWIIVSVTDPLPFSQMGDRKGRSIIASSIIIPRIYKL